jgi:hypothetical protein
MEPRSPTHMRSNRAFDRRYPRHGRACPGNPRRDVARRLQNSKHPHVLCLRTRATYAGVDGRDKPGHDGTDVFFSIKLRHFGPSKRIRVTDRAYIRRGP